jgi:LPXTG-site transpeptidase (sortase) family protein
VRLAIPSIKLDTPVQQGGVVEDAHGNPVWQTLPFVAVHYGDLTALVGQAGNAVIAGHVVTLNEGNVFRFLYQLDLDDQIQVWDDHERERDYHVVDVRLVPPTDTSVMDPTPDETLTLITCGGTFDPISREFSDRLIVVAKPL